jgi:GNAT superfamily N-acetyltransferase
VIPAELPTRAASYVLRRATADDVGAIVGLLAADQIGATRDDPADVDAYLPAFARLDADPAHLLVAVDSPDGDVVATMQLSLLPGLARRGSLRLQIEAVRVHEDHRRHGLGAAMITWAVGYAREHGCTLVQLTSDKSRVDAHRFYERLGFARSHEGYKLAL